MRPAFALALAVLLLACKGNKTQPPNEPPPVAKPRDAAAMAAIDGSTRRTGAEVSAEKRAAYRTHLRDGRVLAKADKWAEGAAEFEAALAAIPGDARALSELSWAAFQAGDYDRAKTASADSARVATDPNLKAASLYNLGRVAEATGDKKTAAHSYRESLKLRHSETVSKRLAALVGSVAEPWKLDADMLPCSKPRPLADLCACLAAARKADYPHGDFECDNQLEDAASWGVVKTTHGYGDVFVNLVGRGDAGWSLAAELEQVFNPGVSGVWEELGDVSVDELERGGRKVLWARVAKSHADSDPGINEEESIDTVRLTICVLDATAGVSCPFQAPIAEVYQREILFDDDEHEAEVGDMHTPGLPISRKGTLAATLGADGALVVTLADGKKTPLLAPYVGTHQLW